MASACEISIIIPVFNEADKLSELLNNIRALRLASSEIIVIDDGSTDGSSDVAMNAGGRMSSATLITSATALPSRAELEQLAADC